MESLPENTKIAVRDDLLSFLAQCDAIASEEPFFNKLARYLSECLEMEFVCIDKLEGDGLTATTLAVYCDGEFEDNISYALKDTPCGEVVGKTVCCFPSTVAKLFPKDQVLQDLNAESYLGVTLWSHTGTPIGLIAVIGRSPLGNRAFAENIIKIVGVRTSGEIERLNAEKALLESEKKYRLMFQHEPNGVALHEIILDGEGKPYDYRFLELNPAFEKSTGLRAADLVGRTQLEMLPDNEPFWVELYGKVALTGEAVKFENFSRELNRYFQVTAYAPEPGKFVTVFNDITDRKLAEVTLKQSEEKFAKAFSACPVLIAIVSIDEGRIIEVNDIFLETTGYGRDELIGRTTSELDLWCDIEGRRKYVDGLQKCGSLRNLDLQYRMRNKEIRDFLVSCEMIELEGQRCSISFLHDITARKKYEESLLLARFSMDHSSDGLFWMTPDARIIDVNESACRSLGYSKQELLQLTIPDIDPEYDSLTWDRFFALLRQQGSITIETVHSTKDGRLVPVEIVANYFQFKGEERNCAIVRNISDRRQAETTLRQSEAHFRSLFDNSLVGVVVTDSDLLITEVNQAFCNMLGYAKTDLIGKKNISELICESETEKSIDLLTDLRNGKSPGVFQERKYMSVSGGIVATLRCVSGIFGQDGQLEGTLASILDITDRQKGNEEKRALEQQLVFAQKMESLGVLSGGIAHDFNNILAIIIGHCSLAEMDYEKAGDHIPEIEIAANRAAELCRQMLTYAGKTPIVKSKINVVDLVREMVRMLKATTAQNAAIRYDFSKDIPLISGDASQIRQVVMNLIINATEAIADAQGEVNIKLTRTSIDSSQPVLDHQGKIIIPGWYVCLEVTDDGCGMENETQQRIFEPFYTTKFTGRGLGMSAVLGIMLAHGGAVQLFSRKGQGTTFKIYLPIQASELAELQRTQDDPVVAWRGSGTVLLVEDEDQIRLLAGKMLSKLGFDILEAPNGKVALDLYRQRSAEICLVVTDIGMPVMNGYELLDGLRKLNPDLPVIVSSGFGDVVLSSRINTGGIAGVIDKPYNFMQFQNVLKTVYEGAFAGK